MTVTAFGFGTQNTAVMGTEYDVPDANGVNVAGVFTFHVDTTNMIAGDVTELRVYQKVLTGGTAKVVYFMAYYGVQPTDDIIKISVPISNELAENTALRFSIKQTFGASRNYDWKILKHA